MSLHLGTSDPCLLSTLFSLSQPALASATRAAAAASAAVSRARGALAAALDTFLLEGTTGTADPAPLLHDASSAVESRAALSSLPRAVAAVVRSARDVTQQALPDACAAAGRLRWCLQRAVELGLEPPTASWALVCCLRRWLSGRSTTPTMHCTTTPCTAMPCTAVPLLPATVAVGPWPAAWMPAPRT